MTPLPEWIKKRRDTGCTDIIEALEIAWEALDDIGNQSRKFKCEWGCGEYQAEGMNENSQDAMRRITELGEGKK